MTTEPVTLHIRRAKATDAVNIFKLIVDEEKRAKTPSALSDGTRIVDILAAIENGYVSVATSSGRIVGSIGALPSDSSGKQALIGTIFVLSPSYHDSPLAEKLLSGLLRVAGEREFPVKFSLPMNAPIALVEALTESGFDPMMVGYTLEPGEMLLEEHSSGDTGRDADVGATGTDEPAADPDAQPDAEPAIGD